MGDRLIEGRRLRSAPFFLRFPLTLTCTRLERILQRIASSFLSGGRASQSDRQIPLTASETHL